MVAFGCRIAALCGFVSWVLNIKSASATVLLSPLMLHTLTHTRKLALERVIKYIYADILKCNGFGMSSDLGYESRNGMSVWLSHICVFG